MRTTLIALSALVAAALALGCSHVGPLDSEPDGGSDLDADSDSDSDGDSDSDADSDSDGDGDGDADFTQEEDDGEEGAPDSGTEPECDVETPVVLYLSADDSNSMSGPVIARNAIRRGYQPYGIRTYEFLNYYAFDYAAAEPGGVRVTAQMRASETAAEGFKRTYNLQIGVRAPDVDPIERRPVNLTLSFDNSGSMDGEPIDLVRASCRAIAGSLNYGDVVSVVTWNQEQSIVLDSHDVMGPEDPTLLGVCGDLDAGGTTDLHAGLVTAYALAEENYSPGRINRVILMSDGGANTGVLDIDIIAGAADDSEGEGIYLLGVGVGDPGYYNDALMDAVTDAGKGAYIFVDSEEEAERMFGERFLANVEIAARDVRVELDLPPSFAMVEFHGEEYSTDPEEVEPQHLAPNDAMIFHQVIGSCDASAYTDDAAIAVTADFYRPLTLEPASATFTTTVGELLAGDAALLLKGDAVVAYAEALKAVPDAATLAERLAIVDAALATVGAAAAALAGDPDLLEIASLLTQYRAIID